MDYSKLDDIIRIGDLVRVLSADEDCTDRDKLSMIGNVWDISGALVWVCNTTRTARYLFNINQLEKINITFEEDNNNV